MCLFLFKYFNNNNNNIIRFDFVLVVLFTSISLNKKILFGLTMIGLENHEIKTSALTSL